MFGVNGFGTNGVTDNAIETIFAHEKDPHV